jgi:hypothetical protein
MVEMNKHLQQTGRTTRQIQQAIALAKDGRIVYFLVASSDHVRHMRKRIAGMWQGSTLAQHNLKVERLDLADFSWEYMRPISAVRSSAAITWIVDHEVVEQQYRNMALQVQDMQRIMTQIYQFTTGAPVPIMPAAPAVDFDAVPTPPAFHPNSKGMF